MTIEQAIERLARPAPVQAAVTPLGAATASVYRLRRQMGDLDATERADVLALLRDELLALPITA